jgi:hypothetical protein
MATGTGSTDTHFKAGADNILPTTNPTGLAGNAATYMNGGKRQQKKQEGGALAFSELKGGKRSRKQQQGGALAFSELKGGAALSPADFKTGDAAEQLKQAGGKKRKSSKKSHKRRSTKRTTVKSLVKGLFGVFKKR